jgi:chromosome segregation ATPase
LQAAEAAKELKELDTLRESKERTVSDLQADVKRLAKKADQLLAEASTAASQTQELQKTFAQQSQDHEDAMKQWAIEREAATKESEELAQRKATTEQEEQNLLDSMATLSKEFDHLRLDSEKLESQKPIPSREPTAAEQPKSSASKTTNDPWASVFD